MSCFLARRAPRRLPPLCAALGVLTSAILLSGCFGSNGGLTFENSSPRIKTLTANGRQVNNAESITASPSETLTFTCDADDPERDPISILWSPTLVATEESTTPAAAASSSDTPAAAETSEPTVTPTAAPDATPTPGTTTSPVYTWKVPAEANAQYTITCTVIDDRGKSAARSVVVVVGTPPTPPPASTPAPTPAPAPAAQ